jgi:hypothetical protein
MTVITLQQANRHGRRAIDRDFCADEIHLAQMASGAERCEHCAKPLFKPSLPKCEHSVYKPAANSLTCSVCNRIGVQEKVKLEHLAIMSTEPAIARTSGVGKHRYTEVRINSSDQILARIKTMAEKEKANDAIPVRLDPHSFYGFKSPAMLSDSFEESKSPAMLSECFEESKSPAMLSEYFQDTSDGDATRAKGYFTGMLRGEKSVETRTNEKTQCPAWILDTVSLREFVLTQQDSARAAAVLYLFYICSQTDGEIASRFRDGEESVKKYRQRLLRKGDAHFGVVTKAA